MQVADNVLLCSAISEYERANVSEFHPSIPLNLAKYLLPMDTLHESSPIQIHPCSLTSIPPGSSILNAAQVTEMKRFSNFDLEGTILSFHPFLV